MDKAAITLRATNAAIALAGKKRTITLLSNEVSKDLVPKLAAAKEIEPALILRAKDLMAKLREAKVFFDKQAKELQGLYTYLQEEHANETAKPNWQTSTQPAPHTLKHTTLPMQNLSPGTASLLPRRQSPLLPRWEATQTSRGRPGTTTNRQNSIQRTRLQS